MMQCENPHCAIVLDADHVVLVTTGHVYRFCAVECLVESFYAHRDAIATAQGLRVPDRTWEWR